jgi:hypothetical protein
VADDPRKDSDYLEATQEADGHWPQNIWLDGRPYCNGLQMDGVSCSAGPTDTLPTGRQIVFTFYWKKGACWEERSGDG